MSELSENEQRHVCNAITTALRTVGFKRHRMRIVEGKPHADFKLLGAGRLNGFPELLAVQAMPSYLWLISEPKPPRTESHFAVHILKNEYEAYLDDLSDGERLA